MVVEGNDKKSLLEGIRTLLSDPRRLKDMAGAARKYAEGRSFDNVFPARLGRFMLKLETALVTAL